MANSSTTTLANPRRDAVGIDAGGGETGAPLSNTAPLSDNPHITILHKGIDSAYLSYQGELYASADERLSLLKCRAQSSDVAMAAAAVFEADGQVFTVRGTGAGRFPYVLYNSDFNIRLSRPSALQLPMATVQVTHIALLKTGFDHSVKRVGRVLAELGVLDGAGAVSRLDMCVDFYSDCNILESPREAWIGRPRKFAFYEEGGRRTGLSAGLGGDMSMRGYDKTLEITRSGKSHMLEVWAEAGWIGKGPVVRMESQMRRSVLKSLDVDRVTDVFLALDKLWCYSLHWLCLALPNSDDSRQSRWPVHPVWEQLRSVKWGSGWHDSGLPKRRSVVSHPSLRTCYRMWMGAMTSYMATTGNFDLASAQEHMTAEALASLHSQAVKGGDTGEGLLRDRALAKATKLGLPTDQAVIEARRLNAEADTSRYRGQKS